MESNSQFWTSEQFFKRLDNLLTEHKMSLCQLSMESEHTSYSSIYKARRKKALPTFQTICSICDALGIPLWEFFDVDKNRTGKAETAINDMKNILTDAQQALERLSTLVK